MSSLSGLKYREITKKLKKLGFALDRQAAGSHEVWYNPNIKFTRKFYFWTPLFSGGITLYYGPQIAQATKNNPNRHN